MSFVHLHLHTDFSCLDGFGSVSEYSEKAAKNNIPYLCVTDHGMGSAYPRMIEECEKFNIEPIFGSEVYLNNYNHLIPDFTSLSEEDKKKVRKNYHLILIAKNNVGYKNLVKLISYGWINGFYYKPRISFDLLQQYSEGIICSSACLGSELSQTTLKGDLNESIKLASEYKELFGEDYYIELQMINIKEQDVVNLGLQNVAKKLNIQTVITNDVHYCEKEDFYNQKIQLLINSRGTVNKPGNFEFHTDQLWYKTEEEFDSIWNEKYSNNIPLNIYNISKENTLKICEECNVKIDTSSKFPVIENADKKMINDCFYEMKKRNLHKDKIYMERLNREYKVITEKNYSSYFMLVKQVINWAKKEGWSVGPGRGCFLPDNIVQCKDTRKKIQEITTEDIVISHNNRFNKVLNLFSYDVDENIIEILMEDERKISCTLDHKIGIKDDDWFKWKEAKDLSIIDEIIDLSDNKSKIKSISSRRYTGKVYDIEVEKDHSYNIDNLAVHNSGAGSLICYLLGITQIDPIKYDLLFERFLSPSRGGKFAKLQFDEKDEIQ